MHETFVSLLHFRDQIMYVAPRKEALNQRREKETL